jgi:uncharacterized protein (DUF2062 family)
MRRGVTGLRTEGAGARRETAAIALGVFIGCLPFYGFHLLLCWIAGALFGLNRLKMYLAANISNPFVAPWLVAAEVQTGAWVRRGAFHPLSREAIASTGLAVFGVDALVGSVVVGALLAAIAAAGTYSLVRESGGDRWFVDLVRRAADRYVESSITAWEFARGKLRMDPAYRAVLSPGLLSSGRTLVDIGCGQGLTLALLAEARAACEEGRWPDGRPPPPQFDRMIGLESRRRVAAIARAALAGAADVIEGDARAIDLEPAHAVLLFDVLHLLPRDDQETLLAAIARRLDPSGVVLVREADAGAGWRFVAVRVGNRLKALVTGTARRHVFCPRTQAEWRACFARVGFESEARPMDEGTPFANVLFRLRAADAAAPQARSALPR